MSKRRRPSPVQWAGSRRPVSTAATRRSSRGRSPGAPAANAVPISNRRTSATWLAQLRLHQAHQARQQAAAEPGLVCRQRIEQANAVGAVAGTHRQAHHLVEALGDEPAANAGAHRFLGRVGQGADAEGPEIGREAVVPVQPRDLLDQVDLPLQIRPPTRHVHRDAPVLGLADHRRADRDQVPLQLVPTAARRRAPGPPAPDGGRSRGGWDGAGHRSSGASASVPPAVASTSSMHRRMPLPRPSDRCPARTGSSPRC